MDNLDQAARAFAAPKPIDDKATAFIVGLIKEGKSTEFIVEKLVANGYGYEQSYEATNLIYGKAIQVHNQRSKSNSGTDIALGAIILTIGIVITVASQQQVIAYGAIIVGIIKLVRGNANSSN